VLAEELAGHLVDHAVLKIVGREDNGGSGVGSSDPDVVQAAVHAQDEFPFASTGSRRSRS